jgi:hypothetical protein
MNSKRFVFLLASFFIVSFNTAHSQDGCNDESFFLTKGTKWVYNTYQKNKLISTNSTYLDSIEFFEDKTVFITKEIITYHRLSKEREPVEGEMIYVCNGNSITYTSEKIEDFTSMYINAPYLGMSKYVTVGKKFKDETFFLYEGVVTTTITERSVVDYELVTTDFGTFNCYLITHNVKNVSSGLVTSHFVKEWFSPEIGLVKTEIYNKKGKLKSSKSLIEFSK